MTYTAPKRLAEKREQFKVMAALGIPYDKIQAALDIGHGTVYLWRREFGLTRRKVGRPKRKSAAVTNG